MLEANVQMRAVFLDALYGGGIISFKISDADQLFAFIGEKDVSNEIQKSFEIFIKAANLLLSNTRKEQVDTVVAIKRTYSSGVRPDFCIVHLPTCGGGNPDLFTLQSNAAYTDTLASFEEAALYSGTGYGWLCSEPVG